MIIVEYKKHLINGVVSDPEFIIDGGYFFNPNNKTWVGFILQDEDRTYYIPDTLDILTADDLISRQLGIHQISPFTKLSDISDPHSEQITLTDTEIRESVNQWVLEKTQPK